MSTMRKRTSLYKNNQALKKWRKKAFRMWKKHIRGAFFTQSVFLITDRKNHIYNRRNVVKWRKRKSAENGETADLEKEETNMYFGVQMYGVSKEWKQDPEGFLKKIYEAATARSSRVSDSVLMPGTTVSGSRRIWSRQCRCLQNTTLRFMRSTFSWMNTTMKENLPFLQNWRRNTTFPGLS